MLWPRFELGTPTTNLERTHALDRSAMVPQIKGCQGFVTLGGKI